MIRRPPRSTLFPTTLFRSYGTLDFVGYPRFPAPVEKECRSEERFSRNAETDLVCRLLLEKKKIGASALERTGNCFPHHNIGSAFHFGWHPARAAATARLHR